MNKDRHSRLKLAARTIIEWNLPNYTKDFIIIISELIENHPYAASWGLKVNSKIIEIDSRGVIISYLIDTLDTETPLVSKTSSSNNITINNSLDFNSINAASSKIYRNFLLDCLKKLDSASINIDKHYEDIKLNNLEYSRRITKALKYYRSSNSQLKSLAEKGFYSLISLQISGEFRDSSNDLIDEFIKQTNSWSHSLLSSIERTITGIFSWENTVLFIFFLPFVLIPVLKYFFYYDTPISFMIFALYSSLLICLPLLRLLVLGIMFSFRFIFLLPSYGIFNDKDFRVFSINLLKELGVNNSHLLKALLASANSDINKPEEGFRSYLQEDYYSLQEEYSAKRIYFEVIDKISIQSAISILETCVNPNLNLSYKHETMRWLFRLEILDD